MASASVSVQIIDASTGIGIPNASVSLVDGAIEFNENVNNSGNITTSVFWGDYAVTAGAWGYKANSQNLVVNGTNSITIELEPGYEDDFFFDFGWSIDGNATAGIWERGIPNGTSFQNRIANPDIDVPDDLGEQAYVTGNEAGASGTSDDVDNGITRLTSPVMDLSSFLSPVARFSTWFFNRGGQGGQPNDALVVKISNGITEATIYTDNTSNSSWSPETAIALTDFITITDNMRIIFEADDVPGGHVLEAGVDKFSITDSPALAAFTADVTNGCFPLTVNFTDPNETTTAWEWTFENGIPATSNLKNPTSAFLTEGTHSVTLIATTPDGTFTLSQPDFIVTTPLPTINVQFSIVNDSTVVFSSNSSNATNFVWDFGDGNTSSEANPTHTYSSGGLVTVTLVATNECCLLYTSPSPRDRQKSRMPSSA